MAKEKLFKRCPRCNEKTYASTAVCDNCKLVFSRLEFASNAKAKQAIKAGRRKQEVIMTKTFPKDLKRWKMMLLSGLGGAVGLHNIYCGRYLKGFFSLFFTLLTAILISVMAGDVLATIYERFLFIPAGLVFIFWFYDFFMIGIKQYKVPIALDIPSTDLEPIKPPKILEIQEEK